jgi:hypothetical protein
LSFGEFTTAEKFTLVEEFTTKGTFEGNTGREQGGVQHWGGGDLLLKTVESRGRFFLSLLLA